MLLDCYCILTFSLAFYQVIALTLELILQNSVHFQTNKRSPSRLRRAVCLRRASVVLERGATLRMLQAQASVARMKSASAAFVSSVCASATSALACCLAARTCSVSAASASGASSSSKSNSELRRTRRMNEGETTARRRWRRCARARFVARFHPTSFRQSTLKRIQPKRASCKRRFSPTLAPLAVAIGLANRYARFLRLLHCDRVRENCLWSDKLIRLHLYVL